MIVSSYLDHPLSVSKRSAVIERVIKKIKKSKVNFDVIAFRGVSGALIAPIIADKMKKGLIVVRKKERHHSNDMVEGEKDKKTYIIIDDFIESGATIKEIIKQINKSYYFEHYVLQGVFTYSRKKYTTVGEKKLKLLLKVPVE